MAVAGGTQGGGGGSGSVGASSCSGGGGGGSASVPGFQPLLLPLAAPLSSPPTPLPPPASALHHLRSTGSPYLRRSVRTTAHGRVISLPSFRAGREGGSPGGGSALRSVRWAGCVAAGRGGDFFLFSSAAADADADADAAVRETEPSMGPQPLERVHFSCGGSAQPSFENGGLHSPSRCALTQACSTHRK